ncbi:MAG: hypothetical protein ABSA79_03670 [Candidatus Bathyarchaeia archaeon]|jgi:sensor histidine kinase YesM
MVSPVDMIPVLSTFSVVGFAITFSLPEILKSAKDFPNERLMSSYIRFVISFEGWGFLTLEFLSLLFMISGSFCLFFYIMPLPFLVTIALSLEIISVFGVIMIIISAILQSAFFIRSKEVTEILRLRTEVQTKLQKAKDQNSEQ